MRSYAQGFSGDYVFMPTGDGFVWEIPEGPMTIRYTATIKDSRWTKVGHRIMQDGKAVRFFEMSLARLGDTNWPVTGTVAPK